MSRSRGSMVVGVCCLIALCGCASAIEIRVQNASALDFADVSIAGQAYGDVAAGETSDYRRVRSRFRYALVRLTAGGYEVNAQTLNFGSRRFTHRIDIENLAAGHLAVEVISD